MAPFFEAIVDLQITLFANGLHECQPDARRCPFLVVMIFVALLAIERLENSVGIEWLLSVIADGEIVETTRDNEVSPDFVVKKSVFQQIGEVDNAIAAILYNNPKAIINTKVIDEYLATHKEKEIVTPTVETDKLILADFRAYNIEKEKALHKQDIKSGETRKKHPTIKDYISSANAIEDYEYDTKYQLYLSDITEDFISDFCEWLADEHVDTEEHKYKCKGEMVNKTINKRLENLSAFIRAYYKDSATAEMIMENRLGDSKQTRVIALTLEEAMHLY